MNKKLFHACKKCGGERPRNNIYCVVCSPTARADRNHLFSALKTDRGRRLALIKERGHVCEMCKLTEWKAQPIPLELEHLDGDSTNNSLENLKLCCPNCHAFTPTYKGRNRGKSKRQGRRKRFAEGKTY